MSTRARVPFLDPALAAGEKPESASGPKPNLNGEILIDFYTNTDIFLDGHMDAEIVWVASTKADLTAASESVRQTMGAALRTAQQGGKSDDAEPMKDDLRDVMEVRDQDEAAIYRLMYTTRIGDVVYVLDFFQKKGVSGGSTPQPDLDRIRLRLKRVRKEHADQQARR